MRTVLSLGGVKAQTEDQQIVGETNKDTLENVSKTEEKDAARINWLQWLASKSRLTTTKPTRTTTRSAESKNDKHRKDPFFSLLSTKLTFPGKNYKEI